MLPSKQNKRQAGIQVLGTWNPIQKFHTIKHTDNAPDGVEPHFEWQADIDKFVELGSKIVITTSTAWWAICELIDFIRNRSTINNLDEFDEDSTPAYVWEEFFTDLDNTTTQTTVEPNIGDADKDEQF